MNTGRCPHCGACQHCGHGGRPIAPWFGPYYVPTYPVPTSAPIPQWTPPLIATTAANTTTYC